MVTSLVRLILASSLATSSSGLLLRSSSSGSSVSSAHRGAGRVMSSAATRDVITESADCHTKELQLLKSAAYESKVAKLKLLLAAHKGGRAGGLHVITDFDLTLTAPGSLQCHHMIGRYVTQHKRFFSWLPIQLLQQRHKCVVGLCSYKALLYPGSLAAHCRSAMLSDASRAHMEMYLQGAVPEGHAPLLTHGDWWDRVHSLLAEHVMKRSDIAAMVSLCHCTQHCTALQRVLQIAAGLQVLCASPDGFALCTATSQYCSTYCSTLQMYKLYCYRYMYVLCAGHI
jgi:hypothetical protein